jgi:hypothetical protein
MHRRACRLRRLAATALPRRCLRLWSTPPRWRPCPTTPGTMLYARATRWHMVEEAERPANSEVAGRTSRCPRNGRRCPAAGPPRAAAAGGLRLPRRRRRRRLRPWRALAREGEGAGRAIEGAVGRGRRRERGARTASEGRSAGSPHSELRGRQGDTWQENKADPVVRISFL